MTTERIHGITFSHMYVNGALLPTHLRALLCGLRALHELADSPEQNNADFSAATAAASETSTEQQAARLERLLCGPESCRGSAARAAAMSGSDVYDNYARKVEARFLQHSGAGGAYSALEESLEPHKRSAEGPRALLALLLPFLREYEERRRGCPVRGALHGDPVFTNVLLRTAHSRQTASVFGGITDGRCEGLGTCCGAFAGEQVAMVDMRGRLGLCCSVHGDALYDYAKVYQSLVGYEHILHGRSALLRPINAPHRRMARRLLAVLKEEVLARFSDQGSCLPIAMENVAHNNSGGSSGVQLSCRC